MTECVVQEVEGKQNCIVALADIAENSLDVFSGSVVPLLLGALVLVSGLVLGKWLTKKIG